VDVPAPDQQSAAQVGSRVTIDFGDGEPETYCLIDLQSPTPEGSVAALSTQTPVGRALLGHRAGDTVTYRAPRGTGDLRLLAVTR
jgi:transcription elongation GreA/GreB family factor